MIETANHDVVQPGVLDEQALLEQLAPGLEVILRRRVNPEDLQDTVQDVLLIALKAIRNGTLRTLEALPGFVRTVAVRLAAQRVAGYARARREKEPADLLALADALASPPEQEQEILASEDHEIASRILQALKPKEREVLHRFYVLEQSRDTICAEMNLTETQFRLMKSRARQRATERFAERRAGVRVRAHAATAC